MLGQRLLGQLAAAEIGDLARAEDVEVQHREIVADIGLDRGVGEVDVVYAPASLAITQAPEDDEALAALACIGQVLGEIEEAVERPVFLLEPVLAEARLGKSQRRRQGTYLLYLNDIVKDEDFELSDKNFTSVKLPSAAAFYDDDRETTERAFRGKEPCMTNCKPEVKITGQAMILDVTPDSKTASKVD